MRFRVNLRQDATGEVESRDIEVMGLVDAKNTVPTSLRILGVLPEPGSHLRDVVTLQVLRQGERIPVRTITKDRAFSSGIAWVERL